MSPWMGAINDNLEVLFDKSLSALDEYRNRGIIQVEPLTYIRGRSIPGSFIIIDEAQNLSPGQVKTIITRVGEGTKIVLTGDIEQIDSPYFDFSNNGLTCIVEKFKDYAISGHITLMKGERSELATLAAKIL
jgi:PhoH-like ATPase